MSLADRIHNDFRYHTPLPENVQKFVQIRNEALNLALILVSLVPDGRELSAALTKLDEMVFWANAGIARNQDA